MSRRAFLAISASLTLLTLAPSTASAQASPWTVTNPVAGNTYLTSNVPIEVMYDWGTGTKVSRIDVTVKDPATGNVWKMTSNQMANTYPTATSIKMTGSITVERVVAPGTPANIVFEAKDEFNVVLDTKTVGILLKSF